MTSRAPSRRLLRSSLGLFVVAACSLQAFVACGGDEASPSTGAPLVAAGAAGAAGSGGGAGASGKAGGSAGTAGAAAGSGGSAGAAGSAGAVAGSAGAAGSAAGAGGCAVDLDCPATLSTQPANCAKAKCTNGKCGFVAGDADGDGHGTAKCKSNDAAQTVVLGDDCDDTNKDISPEGWDGPAGDGKPNHCNDGIDQDCSGVDDDQKLANGGTCTCTPGDVEPCSQTSAGKVVTFPVLKEGKPLLPCKLGSRTCLAGGKWGACTDLREPDTETCDAVDNDCNGVVDDNAVDKPTWAWDADGDLHGAIDCPTVEACPSSAPTQPPVGCASATCAGATCPNARWRSTLLFKADDCDDTDVAKYPGNIERCDTLDNDCDGKVDEGKDDQAGSICVCKPQDPPTACFSGPQGLKLTAPAICREGTAACKADGTVGECTGQVLPGSELCNGLDDDCDGQVDEGFGTIDASGNAVRCDVNGSGVGACASGGSVACSPNGTSTFCKNNDPTVGSATWHPTVSPAPSSSPDWSCDGVVEWQPHVNGSPSGPPLGQGGVTYFTRPSSFCVANKNIADLCNQLLPAACKASGASVVVDCIDDGNNGPVCGQTVKRIGCSYEEPQPADGVKGGCFPLGSTPSEAVVYCR